VLKNHSGRGVQRGENPPSRRLSALSPLSSPWLDGFLQSARRPLEAAAQSKNPLLSLPYAPEPGERTMNFYWLDLFEDANDPGTVYLFGKVPFVIVGTA
jgi:hypothetical protein